MKKKKTYRRKRKIRSNIKMGIMAVSRQPFPTTTVRKLNYVVGVTLDPGLGGAPSVREFRTNSLYDPDLTGVGTQPRGFDELSALYQKYLVLGSKITCQWVSITGTSITGYVYGIALRDLGNALGGFYDYIENGNCKYVVAEPTTKSSPIIQYGYSPKKYHGLTNIRDDGAYGGLTGNLGTGSDPSKGASWHVWAQPADESTDVGPMRVIVQIEYTALFTDPKKLVQS